MTETRQDGLFPDPFALPPDKTGPVETAAATTLAALREHGALDATHALKVELIRQGSRALDRELKAPKLTVAATNMFNRVSEIADDLPTVQAVVADQFERITAAFAHEDQPAAVEEGA